MAKGGVFSVVAVVKVVTVCHVFDAGGGDDTCEAGLGCAVAGCAVGTGFCALGCTGVLTTGVLGDAAAGEELDASSMMHPVMLGRVI